MVRALVCFVTLILTSSASAHVNTKSSWPRVHHIRRLLTQQCTVTSSIANFTKSGQITWVSVQDNSNPQHSHAKTLTQINASSSSSSSSNCRSHLLALYPSPSDPSTTVPLTFVNVSSASPDYCTTGKASVPIKLLNFRTPGFVLRLVSNGTFHPVVLAESAVITNTLPNTPGQIHLALHGDGQSIVVQWVSGSRDPQQLQYISNGSTSRTAQAVQDEGSRQYSGTSSTWPPPGTSTPSSSSSSSSGKDKQGHNIWTVQSSSITYTPDMMCGVPANSFGFLDPGYLHSAVIPAAHVGHQQQLHYRVGSDAVGWSEPQTLTPPPSAASVSSGTASFTFLVFNDVGQENAVLFDDVCPPYCPGGWTFEPYTANSTKLLKHLLAEPQAGLGLLVGDVAYANGYLVDWDYFGFQFEPAFSRWPVMMAPGNHEKDTSGDARVQGSQNDSGGECGVPYTYRYYTPAWEAASSTQQQAAGTSSSKGVQRQAGTRNTAVQRPAGTSSAAEKQAPIASNKRLDPSRSYYSFETGGVHFVMLDSESPSGPDSPQGNFVAQDLAKVDRQRTPWLVVGVHKQMVGPTKDRVNVMNQQRLQRDLEDLFLKHKVDLVLQGHDHAYARTCPYAKGSCVSSPPDVSSTAASTQSSHGAGWVNSSSTPAGTAVPAQPPSGQYSASNASTKASSQPQEVSVPQVVPQVDMQKNLKQVSENVVETVYNPGAPIYILAGHAGAGFTHAFPSPLPGWVRYGVQDRNGYVRVTLSGGRLRAVSVSTDDGSIMDGVEIVRTRASS